MRIYFLIPMYNEQANLERLHGNLINSLPQHEKFFVFADDCSSDNSVAMVKNLFPASNLHVIEKSENKGPGHSFNLGFEWIIQHSKNDNDIIVTLESDNTSDVKILPDMVGISLMGYDLVLASIYAQGGGFSKTSFLRRFLSFGANMVFRMLFDIKVLTLSSFYRVYHVSLVKKIKGGYQKIITEEGFICMLEILIKAIDFNAKVIEIPMILNTNARVGKSKMKIFKTTIKYMRFLLFFRKKKTQVK